MGRYVFVTTTTPTREAAEGLSKLLVEAGAAACVQILGPITSIYRWKGAFETSEEWLLLIKTARSLFRRIERLIRENHPYEVPEIVAAPLTRGSAPYFAWMNEVLSK